MLAQTIVSDTVVEKVAVKTPGKVTAALFVKDSTNEGMCKPYLTGFGNQLAAALNKDGFRVIRPEDSLGMAERVGGARNHTMLNQQVVKGEQQDIDNTSVIQLARDLAADCYFKASITGAELQNVDPAGTFVDFRLDLSLNGYEAQIGGGVYGETVSTTYHATKARFDANRQFIITEALKSAANKIATSFSDRYPKLAPREAKKATVTFNAALNANSLSSESFPLYARVDVDGIAMGTTKVPVLVTEGLHIVTISYPYCESQTFRARFADGQIFNIEMKFTEEGLVRYRDAKRWEFEFNDRKRRVDLAFKHAENWVNNTNRGWNSNIELKEKNAATANRLSEEQCKMEFEK